MIEFSRKQVKAIIKFLSQPHCQIRPALQTIRIRRDGYAYITDGYMAIKFKLDSEPVPSNGDQEEFIIPIENLDRWYKLANTKDKLNELTILELHDENNTTVYPDIPKVFHSHLGNKISKDEFKIDVNIITEFVNITGYNKNQISMHAECIAIKPLENNKILGIIMGLK